MRTAVLPWTPPDDISSPPHHSRSVRRARPLGRWLGLAWCLTLLCLPALTQAQSDPGTDLGALDDTGFSVKAGIEGRAETDLDGGGDVEELRVPVQVGYIADLTDRWRLTVRFNYLYNKYDFANSGFGDQWEHIHLSNIIFPVTFKLNNHWSLIGAGLVASGAESNADFGDSISGGGFGGFIYSASRKFSIGLGIGGATQIADGAEFLFIPILYWEITPKLIVETENNTSRGYSFTMLYRLFRSWHFKGGMSFKNDRFRLNSSDRIGVTRSTTMWGSVIFAPIKQFNVEWYGGLGIQGFYRVEDSSGDHIRDRNLDDPQPFFGMKLTGKF